MPLRPRKPPVDGCRFSTPQEVARAAAVAELVQLAAVVEVEAPEAEARADVILPEDSRAAVSPPVGCPAPEGHVLGAATA